MPKGKSRRAGSKARAASSQQPQADGAQAQAHVTPPKPPKTDKAEAQKAAKKGETQTESPQPVEKGELKVEVPPSQPPKKDDTQAEVPPVQLSPEKSKPDVPASQPSKSGEAPQGREPQTPSADPPASPEQDPEVSSTQGMEKAAKKCVPYELEKFERDVEELVVFKHKHFAEFGLVDTAEDCDARLTARVAEVAAPIREILEQETDPTKRGRLFGLLGRALFVKPSADLDEVSEHLHSATKLHPMCEVTWTSLAECYFYCGLTSLSRVCLDFAISLFGGTPQLLRTKAQTYSGGDESQEKRDKELAERLHLATKAVDMDESDGESWLVLANTYLISYLDHRKSEVLQKTADTIAKAACDPRMKYNDMYYSLSSQVSRERGRYEEELGHLHTCFLIQPSWWKKQYTQLGGWLLAVNQCCALQKQREAEHTAKVEQLKKKRETAASATNDQAKEAASASTPEKMPTAIVCGASRRRPGTSTCFAVVLDADGSMFALIIANASDKFSLREGDIISLDHFSSCLQEGKFNEKAFSFQSVSAFSWTLSINGAPCPREFIVSTHAVASASLS
ncbi:tetratricopeptide repeat protein 5-like [Sycon ciliatum]|uniref:tetratricopeptide repeat protein 5-like n=1 Tax=Sycon ciliatum TaxID=27933 RepID=UPI0031F61AE6